LFFFFFFFHLLSPPALQSFVHLAFSLRFVLCNLLETQEEKKKKNRMNAQEPPELLLKKIQEVSHRERGDLSGDFENVLNLLEYFFLLFLELISAAYFLDWQVPFRVFQQRLFLYLPILPMLLLQI
jgi:hypothetical protein